MSIRRSAFRVLSISIYVSLLASGARANDHEDQLIQKLGETFKLTKLNFTRTDVKTTGSVVVLQVDGIAGSPAQTIGDEIFVPPMNRVLSEGNFKQTDTGKISKTFKKGDRFYVDKIRFNTGGKYSMLVFELISVDSFPFSSVGGTPIQSRYQAEIAWNFGRDAVQAIAVDDILDEKKGVKLNLDPVFKLESEANAVHTQSVELGQTLEQVEATLGKPGKIINLGPKTIYVYSDIKVVFVDGKVADVQ